MEDGPATMLRWAHQGGAREGPSNTRYAMARALGPRGGATALEIDVHRTRDGELVVIHDRTLDRTTDGHGRVRRKALDELRRLDAAYWWVEGTLGDHGAPEADYVHRNKARLDPSFRLPTLSEVLDQFPHTPMTIEIKDWRAAAPVVEALAACGRADVTVTSIGDHVMWLVRRSVRRHPVWVAGLAPGLVYTVWFRLRVAARLAPRRSRYTRIQVPPKKFGLRFDTRRFVDAARRSGMAVDVWTIDDESTMRSLIALGVDGIMTDCPSVLTAVSDDVTSTRGPGSEPS